MKIHIKDLFIGYLDTLTDGPLIGCKTDDGKVYLIKGQRAFLKYLKAFNQQEGEEYNNFLSLFPDSCLDVKIIKREPDYDGFRLPRSLSVSIEVFWTDYDSFHRILRGYTITRKAYETTYELQSRILTDSKIIFEYTLPTPVNEFLTYIDGQITGAQMLNLQWGALA